MTEGWQISLNPVIPQELASGDDCEHGPLQVVVIGGRVEDGQPTWDARICLACGSVIDNRHFDDWFEALGAAWGQFSWHRAIGDRLSFFADLATRSRREAYWALVEGRKPERGEGQ